jgi:hypothetical protein
MARVKFIVSQSNIVNFYKNIKTKVQKCWANTSIYFNRQCLTKKINSKIRGYKNPTHQYCYMYYTK